MQELKNVPSTPPITSRPFTSSVTSPVLLKPLPELRDPQDGLFLSRPDRMAGRHVCIVLYAMSASRDARENAWRSRETTVNMADLGRAAKILETANFNWRELEDWEDVLSAAESIRGYGDTH